MDVELHCPYWPETFAQDYLRLGYWGNHTFASMLATQASQRPTHTALVDGELRLSYAELDRRVGLLADGLCSGGTLVIARQPSSVECFEIIRRESITHTALVPTQALLWIELEAVDDSHREP
ncbi:hypothetical protein [Azorhizophilus paspali]|uniref:AMP-dependent synthetase/ligase domain-containing protein n=1 Tax=Azorhizophilus paspali TaxID=69963 RepID=A0ABV6SIV9_AZOPA